MLGEETTGDYQEVSLVDRMRAHREAHEEAITEDFPVPGWDSVLWVRLKVIGYRDQNRIYEQVRKSTRDKDMINLYTAADILIAATDGFYEVDQYGNRREANTSWLELARGVKDVGEVTPRQAFLRLVGDERVVAFSNTYLEWLTGEREQITKEQAEDFPPTPSFSSATT